MNNTPTTKTHILLAEDDEHIRQGLVDTLESEGYQVTAVDNGQKALDLHETERFHLVILDIMMPEKSGYDVCREIRQHDAGLPILMLTAKSEEIDKVVGFELGADDYVTKPFGIRELLARIAALLRRARGAQAVSEPDLNNGIFSLGPASINRKEYSCTLADKTQDISARELKLLEIFFTHPNTVLSRDELLNAAWGIDYYGTTRTLDQHIAQLRKKVEPEVKVPQVIITVHGVGYKYAKD
jgi:DNA-binding response OmpR family regulator